MNWTLFGSAVGIGFVLCAGVSCREGGEASSRAKGVASATNRREFEVKGVVKEVLAGQRKVRIAHETIPGYMGAMTMTFDVREEKELAGLEPGDEVKFRMVVMPEEGWIERVEKVGHISEVVTAVPSTFRRVRDVDPVDEGDPMPHYTFTNELGKTVSLADYHGHAVAFTFFFTRCPFPNFCPRMSTNFAKVHEQLRSLPDAPTNWHLFSITMDPGFDTPVVLRTYAYAYGHDPDRWNYLTASLMDITAIGEQVGLQFYQDPSQGGSINHNLRTVVVDAAGIIQKIIPGNEWKPEDVVGEIVKAARVRASHGSGGAGLGPASSAVERVAKRLRQRASRAKSRPKKSRPQALTPRV